VIGLSPDIRSGQLAPAKGAAYKLATTKYENHPQSAHA
jgi:hypothetical protein